MLQLDVQQILSQALSFLILLAVLRRFAWGPLLRLLDQRRESIERDLQQAAHQRAETERLQGELAQRLAAIDQEARTKIQQAILEGKRVAIEVQEEARTQARGILAKAKDTVELELDKARVTLRDQVAELTVDAVERVLQQKLDAKSDLRLVESVVDELERSAHH